MTHTLHDRYPGPYPFEDTPQDRWIFFGRNPEIELLSQQIIAARLLVLFGKSGLGKTSLLQAGIFPRLRNEGLLPIPVRLANSAPLMVLIADAARSVSEKCAIDYTPGEMASLWEFFKTAMFWLDDILMVPVLVFDQCEEIFTLNDAGFREAFSREVGTLVSGNLPQQLRARVTIGAQEERLSDAPPKVKIVLSLREEYLGALQELSRDIPGLFQERFRLLPLAEAQAREAIQRPAQLGTTSLGVHEVTTFHTLPFEYADEALRELVAFLKGRSEAIEPFQLQLLCQHIEKRMPKELPPGVAHITVTPSDLGGDAAMNAVLQQFYRDALAALPRGQKRRAQELCERGLLTTAGNRLLLQEEQIRGEYRISEKTLGYLVDQRLMRKELRLESVFYELSHDTLAQSIAQIRRWYVPKKYRIAAVISFAAVLALSGASLWFVLTVRAEKARSDQARAEAERAAQQATMIVEDFLTKLNEEKIKNIQGFGSARKELGEIGLKYYKEFTRQRGEEPSVRAWVWYNLGVSFSIMDNLEEAITAYRKQLEVNPSHARAWNNLGSTLAKQGKLDDAITAYRKQLEVSPNHTQAWHNLGSAFMDQGKLDDAITAYRKQLEVSPNHTQAWHNLGSAFMDQGKLDDAITAYRKQLEVNPEHEYAWNNLGNAFVKQGYLAEAAAAYVHGLAVQPNDLSLLSNDMELALIQGDMTRFHTRMAALAPRVSPQTQLFVLLPFFTWLAHPAHDWRNVMAAIQELAPGVPITWDFSDILPVIKGLEASTQKVAQYFVDFFEGRIDRGTLKARLGNQ